MANNNHFSLTLDTLAPSGSITRPAEYVKDQTTCTITKGDATYMCAWFDTDATGTLPTSPTWVAADDSVTSSFSADGIYYGHVCLMDDVNNQSAVYNTESITYDKTLPTVSNVSLANGASITKTRNITIDFDFDDNLSGAVTCAIDGDINVASTAWSSALTASEKSAKHVTRNIVLSGSGEEDVTKTVSVTVTDNAGNTSTAVSDSIILDTQFLTGNIVLRDETDTKNIIDTWVNDQDLIVRLSLGAATAGDVVGYKVWGDVNADGGATATTEPTSYTQVTQGTNPIDVAKKLTSGDAATKTVYAKVIDDAGNETTLTAVATKYDATAPTGVTIGLATGASQYVSKVDGHKTTTLNLAANCDIAGMKSWSVTMNNTQYPSASGTATDFPATLTVSSDNMSGSGEKVSYEFKLTVEDNAGNTTTSGGQVVYLDTVAPAGSIMMPAWLNGDAADQTTYKKFSTAGATASATDGGAGLDTMTCWCSQTANDTTVVGTQVAYAANPTHAQINWNGHGESATNYLHIQYVDKVGNSAIIHSDAFGIDTTIPGAGQIAFTQAVYNTQAANVTLTAPTSVAPITRMRIAGDIDNGTASLGTKYTDDKGAVWEDVASSRSVTLHKEQDPQPSINRSATIVFYDAAGNFGVTPYASATTELDMVAPSAQLTLFNSENTTAQPAITNIRAFNAHITGHEDNGATAAPANLEYLLYGNFAYTAEAAIAKQEVKEADAVWTAVGSWDTGKDFKTVGLLYAVDPDGSKTVYLKLRDNAGNVTAATPQGFEFDTTAPTVTVSNVDYNRISKVNELRRNSDGPITGKFADETNFTFAPDSAIQAYKVCAYLDQAAVEAGSHENPAIPTTAGSVNMSATGINSNAAVSAKIKGADYETALGEVGEVDGAHFVVVYVQDLGGTWSQKAVFEV